MGLKCYRALRLRYGLLLGMCSCAVWTFFQSAQMSGPLVSFSDYLHQEDAIDRPRRIINDHPSPRVFSQSTSTSRTGTSSISHYNTNNNNNNNNSPPVSFHKHPIEYHHQRNRDDEDDPSEVTEAIKAISGFKPKALPGRLARPKTFNNTHHTKKLKRKRKPYRPTIGPYKRKYPRVLMYVHIHKSAGSMFCGMAYRNRVNTDKGSNCNVQRDQYCCGGKDTMEAQLSYANHTYWDLVSTEREMYDSMAPDYYDYIVTLRDSKQRYYSHWSHLRRLAPVGPGIQVGGFGDASWISGNNTIVDIRTKERPIPPGVDPLGTFQQWIRGQPDNWNTRILCGAKCRSHPKYQITRELFQYTLQRADKFAHFLFVEDMEASYNQLAQAYHWHNYSTVTTPYLIEEKSKRRKDKEEANLKVAQEDWDPLMSALDDALYEFAKRKFHHEKDPWHKPFRNQADVDRYFSEGVQWGCLDACCGNCSSY